MTYAQLETQIQALLKKAEPLRPLDEDDERKAELADIVNQINRLRAQQSKLTQEAELAAPPDEPADRGWLERKAQDLGIAFRANISNATLAKRIEEAQE